VKELPWGIYVHVPWCRRRCPYCDFYFVVGRAQEGFAQRCLTEMENRRGEWPDVPAESFALGGGTPSRLPGAEIEKLLNGARSRDLISSTAEIGMEVNPEDVDEVAIAAWQRAGMTRISMGIQSFDDGILEYLGRKHRGEEARKALKLLVQAGFSVGVDVIMGVPGGGLDRVRADVDLALALGANHLSLYLLTVEEGTPLVNLIRRGSRQEPDQDLQADLFSALHLGLEGLGLIHYEISNYARPGAQSRHNRLYWSQGSYLGIGPGAHSMRYLPDGGVQRDANVEDLKAWWAAPAGPLAQSESLGPDEAFLEAAAFGLRDLEQGIRLDELGRRHPSSLGPALRGVLEARAARNHLSGGPEHFHLTPQGALFADGVARDILGLLTLAAR
jgi:oxygen-independent coproporphyrinogen-3 oxidase